MRSERRTPWNLQNEAPANPINPNELISQSAHVTKRMDGRMDGLTGAEEAVVLDLGGLGQARGAARVDEEENVARTHAGARCGLRKRRKASESTGAEGQCQHSHCTLRTRNRGSPLGPGASTDARASSSRRSYAPSEGTMQQNRKATQRSAQTDTARIMCTSSGLGLRASTARADRSRSSRRGSSQARVGVQAPHAHFAGQLAAHS